DVALEQPRAQRLGFRSDVHLDDLRGWEPGEERRALGEVALRDHRDALVQQFLDDQADQLEDDPAELLRAGTVLDPERPAEELLDGVLGNERQPEPRPQRGRDRRLPSPGRPGDDDEAW